ncbi:MAG: hypothetical protein K2Q26_00705 [Bdellovibrionales bacterium]|nr:hypothetical protein [Bdellovibrionales bacterium]
MKAFYTIPNKRFATWALFAILTSPLILFTNCSSGDSTSNRDQAALSAQVFSDNISSFEIKVVYENGATPYTGTLDLSFNDTWDIALESFKALFQNHAGRVIATPTLTSQMNLIADQGKTNWTTGELVALGETYAAPLVQSGTATITVIFLNGYHNGSTTVLGVHPTGYPFAFIFKDVVTSVGGTNTQQRYVEQATVVHEVGHAIGLVNSGLPMVANHEDTLHPHHSTNNQCVMYWAVESSSSVLSSLSSLIGSSQLNLFGTEALTDGRAYHP